MVYTGCPKPIITSRSRHAPPHVCLGLVRPSVALLNLQRHLIRAAMLRPLQRANRPRNARVDIRTRPRNHARRKRRSIEFVLRIQDQRCLHRSRPLFTRRRAVQQMQKVRGNRILKSLHLDAPAVARVVMPIQQHRSHACHQRVGNPPRAALLVALALRQHATKNRNARAQHVHRMRRRRQQFQRLLYRSRQTAQRPQAGFVCRKLRHIRQLAVHQQVRDLFELAVRRKVLDVVTRDSADRCRYDPPCTVQSNPPACPTSATDFFGLNAPGAGLTSLLIATPGEHQANLPSSRCCPVSLFETRFRRCRIRFVTRAQLRSLHESFEVTHWLSVTRIMRLSQLRPPNEPNDCRASVPAR